MLHLLILKFMFIYLNCMCIPPIIIYTKLPIERIALHTIIGTTCHDDRAITFTNRLLRNISKVAFGRLLTD